MDIKKVKIFFPFKEQVDGDVGGGGGGSVRQNIRSQSLTPLSTDKIDR